MHLTLAANAFLADLEFCELPGIINTPPAERSAAEEAWSRGRCALGLAGFGSAM